MSEQTTPTKFIGLDADVMKPFMDDDGMVYFPAGEDQDRAEALRQKIGEFNRHMMRVAGEKLNGPAIQRYAKLAFLHIIGHELQTLREAMLYHTSKPAPPPAVTQADIVARLEGYNPPDRTFDGSMRQASANIHDAAKEIRALRARLTTAEAERDSWKRLYHADVVRAQFNLLDARERLRVAEEAREQSLDELMTLWTSAVLSLVPNVVIDCSSGETDEETIGNIVGKVQAVLTPAGTVNSPDPAKDEAVGLLVEALEQIASPDKDAIGSFHVLRDNERQLVAPWAQVQWRMDAAERALAAYRTHNSKE